ALALEESFVGADARTALSVGQARGVVLVAAALAGIECTEYAPARVKQAVCGYGRAEKAQGAKRVTASLGLREPPKPAQPAGAGGRDLPRAGAALAPRRGLSSCLYEGERTSSSTARAKLATCWLGRSPA